MAIVDLQAAPTPESIAAVIDWLQGADYKVVRPLVERDNYCDSTRPDKLITVAILDTETTGTNVETDRLIELGMLLVEICPSTGQAYKVLNTFNALEDPGFPIPPEASRVNNITNEMVSGRRIDDQEVASLMQPVSLVIAHNASFDRPFVEERFPIFTEKPWACSLQQIPWSEEGVSSAKLEFLAYRCGFHYAGHRASVDCQALLEVLQHPLPTSGAKAMQTLLGNARLPEIKITALGSPFESKELLRQRGYRWNPDKKAWAKGVGKSLFDDEVAWLREAVYAHRSFVLEQEYLTAKNRFSTRVGQTERVKYE